MVKSQRSVQPYEAMTKQQVTPPRPSTTAIPLVNLYLSLSRLHTTQKNVSNCRLLPSKTPGDSSQGSCRKPPRFTPAPHHAVSGNALVWRFLIRWGLTHTTCRFDSKCNIYQVREPCYITHKEQVWESIDTTFTENGVLR